MIGSDFLQSSTVGALRGAHYQNKITVLSKPSHRALPIERGIANALHSGATSPWISLSQRGNERLGVMWYECGLGDVSKSQVRRKLKCQHIGYRTRDTHFDIDGPHQTHDFVMVGVTQNHECSRPLLNQPRCL